MLVQREHAEVGRGWAHLKRIVVPRSEVRVSEPVATASRLIPIGIPWGYDAVAIDIYTGIPGAQIHFRLSPQLRLRAAMQRGDGGRVAVISVPALGSRC
jgi:hypothetical protein